MYLWAQSLFSSILVQYGVYVLNYFPINVENVDKAAYASGLDFCQVSIGFTTGLQWPVGDIWSPSNLEFYLKSILMFLGI